MPEIPPESPLRGRFEQVMSVYEGDDPDDDGASGWHMHVEISDIQTHPETWGVFLRDVARTLSVALTEENKMTREQAEAVIERDFNSGHTFLPSKEPAIAD
jgi:hypothetical protein